jgi:AcrR family transcriptional regulator
MNALRVAADPATWQNLRHLFSSRQPMPMKPKTERQTARHARILRVARQLVSRVGYDGLTMRDLAAEADVSPTTLYNLYNNKDELVLAAVADLLTVTRPLLHQLAPDPGYERILTSADLQALQVERVPEYAAAITRALLQAPPGHPLVKTLLWENYVRTRKSLRAMETHDQLRDDADTTRMCRLLTGAPWMTMLLWNKGLVPLSELRHTLRDALLATLIANSTTSTRRLLQQRLANEPAPIDLAGNGTRPGGG